MTRLSKIGTIWLMMLLFLLPSCPFSSGFVQINETPLMKARILQSDGKPAAGAFVYLYSYAAGQFVQEGTTDNDGYVTFYYTPHDLNARFCDVHYYLIACGKDGSMAHYHWSAAYINSSLFKTEITGLVLRSLGVNKTPKPIGIRSIHPIKLWERYYYNQPTVVGEVHATTGMSSTFTYATQSGTSIDVMIGIDGPHGTEWSISGSATVRSGWTVTWPPIENTAKETVSYFHYVMEGWSSDTTEWEVFYAYQYNGGAEWGVQKTGDNALWQDVEAGHYGTWVRYLQSASARRTIENGYRYSAGASVDEVTFGITTSYDQQTEIEFKFGSLHSRYYLYDGGTNPSWQVIYATYKPACPMPPPVYGSRIHTWPGGSRTCLMR